MAEAYSRYIDLDEGWVDRAIFHDEDIYQAELRQIFARSWNFVAHESQLPRVGDFLTTCMGEDSVIVTRHRDNTIRVFANFCPHRGNRVCFADVGNTRRFTCNYHGWSSTPKARCWACAPSTHTTRRTSTVTRPGCSR